MIRECMFYDKIKNNQVICKLCPHECQLEDGEEGFCKSRINKSGELISKSYEKISCLANDPIEKKPLFHYKPGENIISIGSFGCNFHCEFCQNYKIAQMMPEVETYSVESLVSKIINERDSIGIAFTYNEPTVNFEYVYDVCRELKQRDESKKIIFITNGYMNLEPLNTLIPFVDAMNIDLKSFSDDFYRKICGGSLNPVLKFIEAAHKKTHIEITTLLVPELNDSKEDIEKIAKFINSLNPSIPLHLSRYFPNYKMNIQPTEINSLLEGRKIAQKYLEYVYIGNVHCMDMSTYCPECKELLVDRMGYNIEVIIQSKKCPKCNKEINITL